MTQENTQQLINTGIDILAKQLAHAPPVVVQEWLAGIKRAEAAARPGMTFGCLGFTESKELYVPSTVGAGSVAR